MRRILLKTISKKELGTLVVASRDPKDKETIIMFTGVETLPDLHCGNCGVLLAGGTAMEEVAGKALLCNGCGLYNIAP